MSDAGTAQKPYLVAWYRAKDNAPHQSPHNRARLIAHAESPQDQGPEVVQYEPIRHVPYFGLVPPVRDASHLTLSSLKSFLLLRNTASEHAFDFFVHFSYDSSSDS